MVSAGGTTVRRNASTFNFIQEAAWVYGGGVSYYEAKPSYQSSVAHNTTSFRGVPDVSFDADPYTGVYVYDTFPIDYEYFWYEWLIVGGTSVSSPALAGIVNSAGHFAASTNAELTLAYSNRGVAADFTDITYGFCGNYMGYSTTAAWDFCTGIGVVNSCAGK